MAKNIFEKEEGTLKFKLSSKQKKNLVIKEAAAILEKRKRLMERLSKV